MFEGANQQLNYHRLFGGQLLAQFIRAASMVCPDKAVKSLHAVFAKEGRADDPVQYQVMRQHEGRSFATLAITARQPRGVLATSSVSMHIAEDGPAHQSTEAVPALLDEKYRAELDLIPWETRCADDLNASSAGPPQLEVWMRTPAVGGFNHRGNGTLFSSAVTSHTIWFHQPFRTDRWLLLRQHSPMLAHGRCFGRGDVLTEDGSLVASYAQEALLRFRDAGDQDV